MHCRCVIVSVVVFQAVTCPVTLKPSCWTSTTSLGPPCRGKRGPTYRQTYIHDAYIHHFTRYNWVINRPPQRRQGALPGQVQGEALRRERAGEGGAPLPGRLPGRRGREPGRVAQDLLAGGHL